MRAPHTVAPEPELGLPLVDPRDERLKHRFAAWNGEACDVALVGVPFDEGVRLNRGRPGAAEGPSALRRALTRFGTLYDFDTATSLEHLDLADAGDIDTYDADPGVVHARLQECLGALLSFGALPIVVGGGNDASFASAAALQDRHGAIGVVNVDAHFDVREVIDGKLTSGTPYRRVLEELGLPGRRFVEFGAHPHVNSRAHHDYLRAQGVGCYGLAQTREMGVTTAFDLALMRVSKDTNAVMVSIDLDVFAAAYAPGVSAPGTEGYTAEEGRQLALAAGRHPKVALFELMELNPRYDLDDRTARLAAALVAAFLSGFCQRERS
jgi:formimidoylglutamase